jgi:gas vesicle protein
MTENNTGSKGGLTKGVLIGGIIGAAAGLLFAPKPGRELRSDLKNRYRDAQDKTKQAVADVAGKTQDMVHQVGQHAADLMDKTKSAVSSAKEEVQTWKNQNGEQQKNVN